MTTATWNGTVIAQSDDTVIVEGNHYFPIDSVTPGVFVDSDHTSRSARGRGRPATTRVVVDGETNPDAAWYYPTPKDAAKQITDRVAFWRGVEVTESTQSAV